MQNKRESIRHRPISGHLPRDVDTSTSNTLLGHELALVDTDSHGYDPYDKTGPRPTDMQIEARFGRKKKH